MIEMGDMACYTARCPQCNRIPPGMKIQSPEVQAMARKFSIKLGRKYSLDIVKKNGGYRELTTPRGRRNHPRTQNPVHVNLQPEVHQQETSQYKTVE
jgi:hypothetical protein